MVLILFAFLFFSTPSVALSLSPSLTPRVSQTQRTNASGAELRTCSSEVTGFTDEALPPLHQTFCCSVVHRAGLHLRWFVTLINSHLRSFDTHKHTCSVDWNSVTWNLWNSVMLCFSNVSAESSAAFEIHLSFTINISLHRELVELVEGWILCQLSESSLCCGYGHVCSDYLFSSDNSQDEQMSWVAH